MKTIKLPRTHVENFMDRFDEEDCPKPVRWLSRQVEIEVTKDWPLQNLFEDALHYTHSIDNEAKKSICRSAKRVVEILNPIVPKEWGIGMRNPLTIN